MKCWLTLMIEDLTISEIVFIWNGSGVARAVPAALAKAGPVFTAAVDSRPLKASSCHGYASPLTKEAPGAEEKLSSGFRLELLRLLPSPSSRLGIYPRQQQGDGACHAAPCKRSRFWSLAVAGQGRLNMAFLGTLYRVRKEMGTLNNEQGYVVWIR